MDFNECNLRQLLELSLRFPRIGAVNFNVLYLILKTIIKKQGIECLTPNFTAVYESPSDSTKKRVIIGKDSESSDTTDEEEQEKERKMVQMEKEIYKLNETVEQLANKISELERRPVQKDESDSLSDEESGSSSIKETSSKTEERDSKTKVPGDLQKPPPEDDATKKMSEYEKKKKILKQGKFIWQKNQLKEDLQDIKKEVESLKESGQKEIRTEMESLQASNEYVVERFEELVQDFHTVTDVHGKLVEEVEELEKVVNKKVRIEDDLEKLKEQVDKLDAYVYSSKYKPDILLSKEKEVEETRVDPEHLSDVEDGPQFVKGEVEKPTKVDRKADFARMVRNFMAMPEEKRAEIRQESIQPEFKKVTPTTMKKEYEKFIKAAQEMHVAKKEEAVDLQVKGTEEAVELETSQLQKQTEIPASEGIIHDDDRDSHIRGTAQKKLHRAVKAITLLKDMEKTQKEARLVKAKEKEAFRELHNREEETDQEQPFSTESFEILPPPSQQVSIVHAKSTPGKGTLLFENDKASQELKERIVLYIKSRLEEMETRFMDKMNTIETSITELQDKNEDLREELSVLNNGLSVAETNQNKFEERLTKADRSDVTQGMSKKDMSMLEDRMLKINETALLDIEELRSFLKDYTVKLRDELDEKVSGFEMDCRLEPLAGKLKRLEKNLKDVSLKARVLECQTMGPIEVKRYLHCEDGKRIKPLRRPISNWTSATQSDMSIYRDGFFDDGETAEKIEADVRKRMEDAVFRDSKHLIGGAYTKTKVARSN